MPGRVFTAEEFIDTVVKPYQRLAAVELVKNRRQYPMGESAAEFVEIEIFGRKLQSVAVGQLGIGGQANISYVRQIKTMLAR